MMVGYIEKPAVNRDSDKFMLRLPDGMRERIRTVADLNGRSMNAEIVATLEKAYPSLEGIDGTMSRIARLVEAAKRVNAEHVLKDVELDLERLVSDALREHEELSRYMKNAK